MLDGCWNPGCEFPLTQVIVMFSDTSVSEHLFCSTRQGTDSTHKKQETIGQENHPSLPLKKTRQEFKHMFSKMQRPPNCSKIERDQNTVDAQRSSSFHLEEKATFTHRHVAPSNPSHPNSYRRTNFSWVTSCNFAATLVTNHHLASSMSQHARGEIVCDTFPREKKTKSTTP